MPVNRKKYLEDILFQSHRMGLKVTVRQRRVKNDRNVKLDKINELPCIQGVNKIRLKVIFHRQQNVVTDSLSLLFGPMNFQ